MAEATLIIKNTFYCLAEPELSDRQRASRSVPASARLARRAAEFAARTPSTPSEPEGGKAPFPTLLENGASGCARPLRRGVQGEGRAAGAAAGGSGEKCEGCRDTPPTTVYLKNIPCSFDRHELVALMDSHGYSGLYDFVYMPMDFKSEMCIGYAFVNFLDAHSAEAFRSQFDGFREWANNSQKVLQVQWSRTQGFAHNIKAFKHTKHPNKFKPLIFRQSTVN